MKSIRFYFRNFGKRCGDLSCSRRGWIPAYSFESGNRGLWISCGRSH